MSREQSAALLLRVDDIAEEAGRVIEAAFRPVPRKRLEVVPGVHASSISRAANGDRTNPEFRLATWIIALARAGAPRSSAQLLVDWLVEVIDAEWRAEALDVAAASEREQLAEGRETALQVICGGRRDPVTRARWIDALRSERAAEATLIRALLAEARAEAGATLPKAA